jgi:transcriptional regulator of arginine metabolism
MAPLPPDERDARRDAVRRLLHEREIRSQEELAAELTAMGYAATQSSLSRDLRELRAAKLDGRYVLPEAVMRINGEPAESTADLRAAASFVRDLRPAGPNLVVVRTTPGSASAVALAIDATPTGDVVGTVAGDDTLFVAVTGRAAALRFEKRMRAALVQTRTENAGA